MKLLSQSEKKVLSLLEQDCRLPAKQIAKKARLSPEGVLKIIRRLEDAGVITRFNTKYNYSRMGQKIYPVAIKLSKLNKEVIGIIKQMMLRHKTCVWFTFCEGEYDLLLSFRISSENDKQDMDSLLLEMSDYVAEKDVSIALLAFEISKSFDGEGHSRRLFPVFDFNLEAVRLSLEERKILDLLKENSRETVLNIAGKVGIGARAVSSKIKKLEKDGIISGFKTKVNTAALGFQPCIALISFNSHTTQDMRRFVTYCQHKQGINYLLKQIGKYDVELTIDLPDVDGFYSLMEELREQFRFIKKVTTLISK